MTEPPQTMLTAKFPYEESHDLQNVTVVHRPSPHYHEGYWVILIHGGAWRDPAQTSTNYLEPVLAALKTSPEYSSNTLPHITGFASISYRLSPHPNHPQDPQTTDPKSLRSAKHPDHIYDVIGAISLLQRMYGFGERYILVGHSCGATLAFQAAMGRFLVSALHEHKYAYATPAAILGVAGIYNLRLLRDAHRDAPAYQEIIENAFGSDEDAWDAASPAIVRGNMGMEFGWNFGRLAVLAYSNDDGLVDSLQWESMRRHLDDTWVGDYKRRSVVQLPIEGEHDEAWEKGDELARAIAFTLGKLLE